MTFQVGFMLFFIASRYKLIALPTGYELVVFASSYRLIALSNMQVDINLLSLQEGYELLLQVDTNLLPFQI